MHLAEIINAMISYMIFRHSRWGGRTQIIGGTKHCLVPPVETLGGTCPLRPPMDRRPCFSGDINNPDRVNGRYYRSA